MRLANFVAGFLVLAVGPFALAQDTKPKEPPKKAAPKKETKAAPHRLPISKLAPAKIVPNLCLLKYHVTTASPQCQAFFDQGLGYFYSYVWMEAARSFETAAKHDPECAMAW